MNTPRSRRRFARAIAQPASHSPGCSPLRPAAALLSLLAVLSLPAPVAAQAPAPATPATAPQGAGRLTGRVVDAATGKYLEGAEVSLQGTGLRTNASRDGMFQFTGVPAGEHTVVVNYLGMESAKTVVTVAVTGHFKTSHLGSPKNQPPQNVESKEHFFSNKLHISR
ncbi:MAG TPA: carboxypeptidase-like regulatory domain-containing protein [Opitutaceae bacterium]|nr:carboxypeptidase-like regulatory domain-containing protein [Opitutaceae bacterium]